MRGWGVRLATVSVLSATMATLLVTSGCAPSTDPVPTSSPSTASATLKELGIVRLAGVSYGPFHAGQRPDGPRPSAADIASDIPTLATLTGSIRIYSAQGSATSIVRYAASAHLSVNLGIWLGRDAANNGRELAAGIRLMANPAVTTVTVGNEVLFRGDLSEPQLLAAIDRVRRAAARLTHRVRVTTAETDATWRAHPELADGLDLVTAHIYPFWAQVPVEGAIGALDASYRSLTSEFAGQTVVIGETGWPSAGPAQGPAVPSEQNQARFFEDFVRWTRRSGDPVEYFWFEAFDESWKSTEAGVGTHWGLIGEDGVVKAGLRGFLPAVSPATIRRRSTG